MKHWIASHSGRISLVVVYDGDDKFNLRHSLNTLIGLDRKRHAFFPVSNRKFEVQQVLGTSEHLPDVLKALDITDSPVTDTEASRGCMGERFSLELCDAEASMEPLREFIGPFQPDIADFH